MPNVSFPLAPADHSWDGSAAEKRIGAWAGDDAGKMHQCYMYHTPDAGAERSKHKLPFVDIINGKPHIVRKALQAIYGVLRGARGGVGIPNKASVLTRVKSLLGKFGEDTSEMKLADLRVPYARLGRWKHPKYTLVEFTQEMFDQVIRNFNDKVLGRDVFIRLGHSKEETDTWGGDSSLGWVTGFVQDGDVLYAQAVPTNEEVEKKVRSKELKYSSAEYNPDFVNKETGERVGMVASAIALTNEPFIPNLPEVEVLGEPGYILQLADPTADNNEEVNMEEVRKELEEQRTLIQKLADGFNEFKQMFSRKKEDVEVDEPKPEPDAELVKKLAEASERHAALEKKVFLSELEVKLTKLSESGCPPVVIDRAREVLRAMPAPAATIKLSDPDDKEKTVEIALAEGVLRILEDIPKVDFRRLGYPGAKDELTPEDQKKQEEGARDLVASLGHPVRDPS